MRFVLIEMHQPRQRALIATGRFFFSLLCSNQLAFSGLFSPTPMKTGGHNAIAGVQLPECGFAVDSISL
jgi:hypothetical protein